ncbi:MAG: hypothetical protein K6G83_14730 [Lachnospiraceae bacterium]|nr:hypothetical protein [Lachnospiraceae bacterium]
MEEKNEFSKLFSDTVEKIKELGGAAKLHALIKAEEAKKQELYYRLGKKYYKLFQDSPEKDLKEIVEKLLACDAKIAEYKQTMQDAGESFRDVEKKVDDIAEEVSEEVDQKMQEAAQKADDTVQKATEVFESAKDLAKDIAEDFKESEAEE